jgi:hypothetical protein
MGIKMTDQDGLHDAALLVLETYATGNEEDGIAALRAALSDSTQEADREA